MPEIEVRPASTADTLGWALLRQEAFAGANALPSELPSIEITDSQAWVAAAAGQVLGCARDNHLTSWFGGRRVPTSAISSVVVQAEWRGRGILARLLPELLTSARQRGAAISTLYPTAPAYYRRYGYEVIGSYDWIEIATSRLAGAADPELTVERVTPATWPAVEACYARWAAAHNGPLGHEPDSRFGLPSDSTRERALLDLGAVTLARDASGDPVGYAAWERTDGYRAAGVLAVTELCALDVRAFRRLVSTLATHSAVAPTTRIAGSGWGDVPLGLASAPERITESTPYMLTIVDVVQALETRGYADRGPARIAFAVSGLPVPGQDGTYELVVADGRAECRPTARADIEVDARGLALLYGGTLAARARWAGLVRGPAAADAELDRIFGGLPFAIRDYF